MTLGIKFIGQSNSQSYLSIVFTPRVEFCVIFKTQVLAAQKYLPIESILESYLLLLKNTYTNEFQYNYFVEEFISHGTITRSTIGDSSVHFL